MVGDFVTAPTRNETEVVRQEADKRSSTTGRTDSSERCDVSKSVSQWCSEPSTFDVCATREACIQRPTLQRDD